MVMSNSKQGRTTLRPLPGPRATGVCLHTVSDGRLEAVVSAQSMAKGASLTALLQYGPMEGYRCLPTQPLEQPLEAKGLLPAAVWVLDRGTPVLWAPLATGPFELEVARARLLQPVEAEGRKRVQPVAHEANVPEDSAPAPAATQEALAPSTAEEDEVAAARDLPAEEHPEWNIPAVKPPEKELPPENEDNTKAEPPNEDMEKGASGMEEAALAPPWDSPALEADIAFAPAVDPAFVPAAEPDIHWTPQPLVIERAPRPGPPAPVYSPLWDDVSAEFERMLDALPTARPFHSRANEDAQFAQLPLGGEVQCYIGSVVIEGRHVFLQAVPSRPYGRPAGFDHTLVARDGTCYWVKYFIEEE